MARTYVPGSIKEMLVIALPMVVSQACDTIMIFTDRLFLAKLGPELMNASMGGGLTMFMMMSFFIGLVGYTTAIVAQYVGAGQKNKCAVVASQAVLISVLAYPLILAGRPLAYRFFEGMGVSAAQMVPQKIYFDILCYASVVSLLRVSLSGFFSGIGRTRVVMVSSCVAMVVNVVANYVLVYGKAGFPALGIVGSAYGTIVGGVCGLLVLVCAYFSRRYAVEFGVLRSFVFDRLIFLKVLRFGSPAGAEMVLNIVAFNAMVMIFHSHGLVTATAATIMFNWDLVSFVPLIGAEIGVTSLVGRYMGAGDPDTAHKAVMSGLKVGVGYSLIVLVAFVGFAPWLVTMFCPVGGSDTFTQAYPLALFMVRFASVYVLVEALYVVFVGALRGAGDTVWAMALSTGVHWATVVTVFVLLNVLNVSARVAWAAVVILFFFSAGLVYARYKSGAWRKLRVVERPPVVIDVDVPPAF